jgi:hypothetical protein
VSAEKGVVTGSAHPAWARLSGASRVLAALLGSAGLTLSGSLCLALTMPEPRRLGVALGVALAVPLWVAAMIPGFLARRAWRAWAGYLGGTAVFVGLGLWLR